MSGDREGTGVRGREALWWLAGSIAFGVFGFALQDGFGIPFFDTYRVGCAALCLGAMAWSAWKSQKQRWQWVALAIAILVNIAIFISPIVDRPVSRGEIIAFALPDAIVFLALWIAFYPVRDGRDRTTRLQMAVVLIAMIAFYAFLVAMVLKDAAGR